MKPLVILDIASRVTEALVKSPSVPAVAGDRPQIREVVQKAIVTDPVLINELNGEKPIQSCVLWGNFIAGIGALPTAIIELLPVLTVLGFWTSLRPISSAMASTPLFKAWASWSRSVASFTRRIMAGWLQGSSLSSTGRQGPEDAAPDRSSHRAGDCRAFPCSRVGVDHDRPTHGLGLDAPAGPSDLRQVHLILGDGKVG
jgi:hypothetical protein